VGTGPVAPLAGGTAGRFEGLHLGSRQRLTGEVGLVLVLRCEIPTSGQDHGPDGRDREQQGRELEGVGVAGEHGPPEERHPRRVLLAVGGRQARAGHLVAGGGRRLRPTDRGGGGVGADEGEDERPRQQRSPRHGEHPRDGLAGQQIVVVDTEQHDHEQEQDHDRAGVDQDLDDREEGGFQREVEPGDREEVQHEHQSAVHDVAHRDDGDG
jgi:hypothetical protein